MIIIIFLIIMVILSAIPKDVNGQTQQAGYVLTATSPTTFGWYPPAVAGNGLLSSGSLPMTLKSDSSIMMTVNRASDSIASIKASLDTKLNISAFTASAMIDLFGFTPYSNANPNNYITSASLSGYVQSSRTISTTSPLSGGGDLSTNRTLTIANSKADNSTKGAATFDSSYFNDDAAGLISWSVNYATGTVSANAVTINSPRGKISYNSPNIVAAGTIGVTLTNSYITSTSIINVGLNGNGSNLTAVNCYVKSQTNGSAVINISNLSLLNLFNTSFQIDFFIVN